MSKKAMKLALEALEAGEYYIDDLEAIVYAADDLGTHEDRAKMQAAITALREALTEPQEKYIYGTPLLDAMTGKANEALDKKAENARELGLDYEPAQQEPVTPCTHPSLGFCSLREDGTASRWSCVMCGTEFVPKATNRWAEFNEATKRNIEHAEWYMSTHANLVQQTPTAWILKCGEQQELWWEKPPFGDAIPLYTFSPAQRTWVGLTDEEANKIYKDGSTFGEMMRMVEAKLKEKNT